MKTAMILAASSLLVQSPDKGVVFSNCAPRDIALAQHERMGFERDRATLQSDDQMFEVWRNKHGKRFGTVMDSNSGRTCFVGNLPDEPEV
jgi:hypothetical protein